MIRIVAAPARAPELELAGLIGTRERRQQPGHVVTHPASPQHAVKARDPASGRARRPVVCARLDRSRPPRDRAVRVPIMALREHTIADCRVCELEIQAPQLTPPAGTRWIASSDLAATPWSLTCYRLPCARGFSSGNPAQPRPSGRRRSDRAGVPRRFAGSCQNARGEKCLNLKSDLNLRVSGSKRASKIKDLLAQH
jgi:hypothetical protein